MSLPKYSDPSPNTEQAFEMRVGLNVLDHLGINLYSNIAAVLTEVIANAWDADAKNVTIHIDHGEDSRITMIDDGIGMTIDDINNKYLLVGYRRRDEDMNNGKCTKKGRTVMGRKGLGKLSLFSIADVIEVQSAKDGQSHGFRMSAVKIREAARNQSGIYYPKSLNRNKLDINQGTKIVLKEIKRQRLGPGAKALRKRLARRFSIIGETHDFRITINEEPVTYHDRDDLSKVQFLWMLGEPDIESGAAPGLIKKANLPDQLDHWDKNWKIRGWIGTVQKPKQLDNPDVGNLNSIVVFARGRLFHENILDKVNNGRLYTKYLTGQIEADFLDDDHNADIATSDRQRIQEDDPRYIQLLEFLKSSLKKIDGQWNELRHRSELKQVKATFPALDAWFKSLPEGYRNQAEKLVAKLSSLPLEEEDDRKLLYKHGILAFQRMKVRGSTRELVNHIGEPDKLLQILSDRDAFEASLYRDIIRSRLEVVEQFQSLIEDNQREKLLQDFLFDHLWLLDPAWERATSNAVMESCLTEEGVIIQDMTAKEKLGRVDIAYRTDAGKHIIVELKRAERKIKLLDLVEQGQTYVDKVKKIQQNQGDNSPNIEVIFVIGKPLDEESSNPDRVKASMASVSPGSRIVHYDFLIRNALEAYSEYLEKSAEIDKIDEIIDQL